MLKSGVRRHCSAQRWPRKGYDHDQDTMNPRPLTPLGLSIAFVSLLLMGQSQTSFAAERGTWHLDLSQFGYTALPPKPATLTLESIQSPHLVDFDEKGNVVVGILERAQELQSRSANKTTLQISS